MTQVSSCNHPLRNEFLGKLRQNAFILDTRVLTSQQLLLMKTSPPGWVEGVSSSHYPASFFISLISSAKIGVLGRIFKVLEILGFAFKVLGSTFQHCRSCRCPGFRGKTDARHRMMISAAGFTALGFGIQHIPRQIFSHFLCKIGVLGRVSRFWRF